MIWWGEEDGVDTGALQRRHDSNEVAIERCEYDTFSSGRDGLHDLDGQHDVDC